VARATNEIPVNVVREEPAPCRVKLDVEVSAETVDSVIGRVEKEYRRYARIPGFRPGKAPRTLLKRHYGTRILDDAKDRILREGTQGALSDQDISPLTVPQVENEQELTLEESAEFVFAVEFDTTPTFEVPDYKTLTLPSEDVGVEDEKVEDFISQLLSSRASYDKVDRAAEEGDLLKATYQARIDEEMEIPPTAKFLAEGKDTWVALRDPEILPGVTKVLAGAEPGSQHDIEIEFPEDFYETAFAGKKLPYHFEILEVHASSTPELTDDVAQQLGAESADDVRERVRANLESEGLREKAEAVRTSVVDQLLGKIEFSVPPSMHARESYDVLVNMYQEAARGGTDEAQLREQLDSMRQQADEQATANLKRRFVLEKIADEEDIRVDPQELDATIKMMASYQKVTEKKCLQRLRESGRLMDLLDDMRSSKVIQRIIQLNTTDAGADADEAAPQE